MNILISCIGRRGYLARFFREAGAERVLATSNSRWTPGFKDCDGSYLLPDIASDGYIDTLLELCRVEDVGMILSAFDLDIDRLAPHRQRFVDAGIATFVADERVSRFCIDKIETGKFLDSSGLCHPKTFETLAQAKLAIADETSAFPLFVKPRFGFGSKHLFIARSVTELEVFFEYSSDMIAQEAIPGREYSFDILNDLNGEVIRAVVKEKVMMRSGETDQAVTVHNDELQGFAKRLGRITRHVGPMDVDVFWDGHNPVVLEMNPRFGGGYPISHLAGADFPKLMLELAKGADLVYQHDAYEPDIQMMKAIVAFECSTMVQAAIDLRDKI